MDENPIIPSLQSSVPWIPIEIISEEEMALIEAAFAAAVTRPSASSLSPSKTVENLSSRHVLAACSEKRISDIEDAGVKKSKKSKPLLHLLNRFRHRRGLMVTDLIASEWCEKQMEFKLLRGPPKRTAAMQAGSSRHAELEEEVVQKVEIPVRTREDSWAVKLMNFISGINQLLFDGLTREIPVISLVEGVWVIGVIDEIRMSESKSAKNPLIIDTKTRSRPTLPSEAQKRNARLQLMCYKFLWDSMIADNFPMSQFFDHFGLDPRYTFSDVMKHYLTTLGSQFEMLADLMTYFRELCKVLSPAHEQLLLRYEFQGDLSLLGEEEFSYDSTWVRSQINLFLQFWKGEREAGYVSADERWKCQHCPFVSCPAFAQTKVQDASELNEQFHQDAHLDGLLS